MARQTIKADQLATRPFSVLADDWMLLSAGDYAAKRFNSMTIAWGAMGTMWGQPSVMVVVRPQRHTKKFLDEGGDFTICSFSADYQDVLRELGSKSGTEMDKVNASGLTPIASTQVASPGYDEATLIIECRKAALVNLDPKDFFADYVHEAYENHDYHVMYFGQIVAVHAEPHFIA